jgi:hypothetical protein
MTVQSRSARFAATTHRAEVVLAALDHLHVDAGEPRVDVAGDCRRRAREWCAARGPGLGHGLAVVVGDAGL